MPSEHNRRLGLIGTAMTMARMPRYDIAAMTAARDSVDALIDRCGFLNGAPFEWVSLALRFGLVNEDKPHYQRINKKDGDLPLAIELDTNELLLMDQTAMQRAFEIACLRALVHAGRKYELSYSALEEQLKVIS